MVRDPMSAGGGMIQPVHRRQQVDKAVFARELAAAHLRQEDTISRIVRLVSGREADADEPLKILEVNSETFPSGIVPIYFGTSDSFPVPTILIEITDEEFEKLQRNELRLPEDWQPGEVLHPRTEDAA